MNRAFIPSFVLAHEKIHGAEEYPESFSDRYRFDSWVAVWREIGLGGMLKDECLDLEWRLGE